MAKETPVAPITVTAAAKKLGALGGAKGGPARAKALTKGQKQAIGRKGGLAKAANRRKGK